MVTLAAEIAVDFPGKKVTLVHRGSRLLEFIGEKAGKVVLDWLVSKNVEVILGQSVKLDSLSNGTYETSGGEIITADCHYLCIGSPLGSSWLKKTCLKDNLDARGRLIVDPHLRVKGHSNIFAIGDITDIPDKMKCKRIKTSQEENPLSERETLRGVLGTRRVMKEVLDLEFCPFKGIKG